MQPSGVSGKDKQKENRNSLYERLYKKRVENLKSKPQNGIVGVIDSRTLDDVSEKSASSTDVESSSESETSQSISIDSSAKSDNSKKFDVQIRLFEAMINELKNKDREIYTFRAIPKKWDDDSQMCDVFLMEYDTPENFDPEMIYILINEYSNENDQRITKEIYVKVNIQKTSDGFKNIFPSIEINDVLLASQKIEKFSRIRLSTKKTVLNFVEKIELSATSNPSVRDREKIIDEFKQLLSSPLLINQDQIFKLCGGRFLVQARIYPESFR